MNKIIPSFWNLPTEKLLEQLHSSPQGLTTPESQ
jgi:hypothetical protein